MKYVTKLRSFTTALVLLVSVFSCEKKELDTLLGLIAGKWEWIETMGPGPGTGISSTPQTAGYTIFLEFTSPGIMKEYKNDVLVRTSNYKIESGPPNTNYYIFVDYFGDTHSQIYINGDTLLFNAPYVDGPVSFFLRIR